MLIALESYGGSYLGICTMLNQVADDLEENQSFVPVAKTVDALKHAESAYLLLHAIPSDLLASIIRGTVAYDFLRGGRKPHQYSKKTGGTYVAAVSISGRDGKFLSGKELGTLASLIEDYIEAYDDFVNNGFRWDENSGDSQTRKRFIASVDGVYGKTEPDASPRFVRKPAHRQSTKALAEMFRRREKAARDPDEQHIQSPLMVGCNGASKKLIKDRVAAHYPKNGLTATTHTWAITLCLLGHMGRKPIVTTVAVLPTWERNDLPLSERLVTALAQSLVTQDGFNVDQPGKHPDGHSHSSLITSRQMVMGSRSWFRDALDASIKHIAREREDAKVVGLLKEKGPKRGILTLLERRTRMRVDLQRLYVRVAQDEEKLEEQILEARHKQTELRETEEMVGNLARSLEEICLTIKSRNANE